MLPVTSFDSKPLKTSATAKHANCRNHVQKRLLSQIVNKWTKDELPHYIFVSIFVGITFFLLFFLIFFNFLFFFVGITLHFRNIGKTKTSFSKIDRNVETGFVTIL